MSANAILFGWNRAIPGREKVSSEHFDEFVKYLEQLRSGHTIDSWEVVVTDYHSGDLNGFFLVRGDSAKLETLLSSPDWQEHQIRAGMHLERSGAVRAYSGDAVMARMEMWRKHIP